MQRIRKISPSQNRKITNYIITHDKYNIYTDRNWQILSNSKLCGWYTVPKR